MYHFVKEPFFGITPHWFQLVFIFSAWNKGMDIANIGFSSINSLFTVFSIKILVMTLVKMMIVIIADAEVIKKI